jgi:TPR repeat protein
MNKQILPAILLLVMMVVPVYANDFQEGLDAIHETNYEKALEKLIPLAEHGHPAAQYNIGVMHEWGNGVTQDNANVLRNAHIKMRRTTSVLFTAKVKGRNRTLLKP